MRVFLISLSAVALFLLVGIYSQVSAAPAASALANKAVYGQAHALVEKVGWRKRRWRRYWRRRYWYGPRVYGYYYAPPVYGYYYRPRGYGYYYGPPPVYGYYRPYRYRGW